MTDPVYEELWLLDPAAIATPTQVQGLPTLNAEALEDWIAKVHQFQHRARHAPLPRQPDLFGGVEIHPGDPYQVDPFALDSYPFNFYESADRKSTRLNSSH